MDSIFVTENLKLGEESIQKLKGPLCQISGSSNLIRMITADMNYLQKAKDGLVVNKEIEKSSNMGHFSSIVDSTLNIQNVCQLLAPFRDEDNIRLVVDIVANSGREWYKVISRRAEKLHHQFVYGSKKERPLDDVAKRYISTAKCHPILFTLPKISFLFLNGVSEGLASCLRKMGIVVLGKVINDVAFGAFALDSSEDEDESDEVFEVSNSEVEINTVNLDITCLIAYCSNLTNNRCDLKFRSQHIASQATWEMENPAKVTIDQYIKDKKIIVCKSAIDHLKSVANLCGGPTEQKRIEELLHKCEIVDPVDYFKDELPICGRIKLLPRLVFGTGHAYKAPTITSNVGFINAANGKGVKIAAITHEARSFSELSEIL